MRTFVVPDAHGNWRLVRGLLEQEEIIDIDGKRIVEAEVFVVQLGDLANCVAESINHDLKALELVGPVIDLMLVGNHEHPYFGGPPFRGFWPDEQVKRAILRLHDYELIRAAHEVDGILLTHAGVAADIVLEDADAARWSEMLNEAWRADPRHHLFSLIGHRRGGMTRCGGVLWSDWREPHSLAIPQVFGHTVGNTFRAHYAQDGRVGFWLAPPYEGASMSKASALCLDIGAGKNSTSILGAWIEEGVVRIVQHSIS